MTKKLPLKFFQRDDVVEIAKDLIGTYLYTQWGDDPITGGMIIETEAYGGIEDRASHAFGKRQTKRTATMYLPGGVAYVYLCYGIHNLFNIITGKKDVPHGVLIRAIQPLVGIETMEKRRNGRHPLTSGPGTVTQALGIKLIHNGLPVTSSRLWLEPRKEWIDPAHIIASPRIGIDYAKEHALLPWRFNFQT